MGVLGLLHEYNIVFINDNNAMFFFFHFFTVMYSPPPTPVFNCLFKGMVRLATKKASKLRIADPPWRESNAKSFIEDE